MISSFRQKVQASTDWGKPEPAIEAPQRAHKTGKRQSGAASDIKGHRLFPAFTALWFAALFGLGSLAISSEVLGKLVTAIRLPTLVPAAAPPLGFTAHLLVALLLTIVGGGLGLVLGLRLRPQTLAAPRPIVENPPASEADGVPKVRARDAHPDAPPRRPLVLTEAFAGPTEITTDEIMVPAAPLLRRKPGQTEPDHSATAPEAWLPVYTPGGDAALPPLDLAESETAPETASETAPETASEAGEALPNPLELAAEPVQELDAEPVQEQVNDLASEPVIERGDPPVPVPVLLAATPQIPSGLAFPMPNRERILAGETWSPVASAPLDSLGLVQLIERLALAIAARKAASLAGPPPPTDGANPEGAEPEPEALPDTGLPIPGPFAKPMPQADAVEAPTSETLASDEPIGSAREAIMRRLGAVAAQGPGESAPAPFSRPAQALVQVAEPADAVVPMRQPESPVRSFAAPAAPTAAPASLETDEALRTALATLQRMSARG